MRLALDLAVRGRGAVEPNPMVGCVIAHGAEIIGLGWHRRYGGPHAEIEALSVAGERAAGAAMYVTLEPCCHHGKTPPCTQAVIAARIRRVIVAQRDPFPAVDGGGLAELRAAGVEVELGVHEAAACRINAPYLKLLEHRPALDDGQMGHDARRQDCHAARVIAAGYPAKQSRADRS